MERLVTKDDLLEKLREYRTSPDDENIYYKQKMLENQQSNMDNHLTTMDFFPISPYFCKRNIFPIFFYGKLPYFLCISQ